MIVDVQQGMFTVSPPIHRGEETVRSYQPCLVPVDRSPSPLASEVMRAALRALDREEAAVDEWLRQRVDESLNDPRPSRPAGEVFKRLRAHHAGRSKSRRDEKI